MLFNSPEFLIFFPAVTLLYFALPHASRWPLLLAASCLFYMAFIPAYILILFLLIAVDYAAGILIEGAPRERKKLFLVASLVSNGGILFLFKYFNFFSGALAQFSQILGWQANPPALSLLLPIGLSFHTFQSLSYVIEVYRGRVSAERHLGRFSLYVMFYPQLVAGPIERPYNLLPQFLEKHDFDEARAVEGLRTMLWGFFKKIVVADRLALFADAVYSNPAPYEGVALILATVFFAFQIFCDFSGYSDIAIGAAKVMGFRLMRNFDHPYASGSVREFWTRWHISLSSWFRDYLYIPLGGNRAGPARRDFNVMLTFLASGLWHGANWTFLAWGGLNGLYLLCGTWTQGFRRRMAALLGLERLPAIHSSLNILATFSLICFSWIFFRANNMGEALYVAGHLFSGAGNIFSNLGNGAFLSKNVYLDQGRGEFYFSLFLIALVLAMERFRRSEPARILFAALSPRWRYAVYYLAAMSILLFGRIGREAQQFIYFQF